MTRQEHINELERKLTLTGVSQPRELLKDYTKWLNDKIRDEDDLNELIDDYFDSL
jgi:uncharacterized membrane protein